MQITPAKYNSTAAMSPGTTHEMPATFHFYTAWQL